MKLMVFTWEHVTAALPMGHPCVASDFLYRIPSIPSLYCVSELENAYPI